MVLEQSNQQSQNHERDFQSALEGALRRLGIHDLNTIQKLSLKEGILGSASLMVVAPSGSGKTLIALMAILKLLVGGDGNSKAVLLVPLKALALQQFNLLKNALGEMGAKLAINTGDFSLGPNRGDLTTHQVLIMTYERFDLLIRSKTWWLKRIKLVIIDEINYLAEKVRGPRLEATIVRLKENMPHTQLITLCPPVSNASEIADWLGCRLVVGEQRPVPLHTTVVLTKNKSKSVAKLCSRTVSQGGSVIVFTSSRSRCDQIAFSLLKPIQTILKDKEKADAKELSVTLLNSNDEIQAVTRKLASVIQGGVAFHHAGLSAHDRNLVEEAFREGRVKVVVCTTTLGTGVNTPARMVIITETTYLDVESIEFASRSFLKRIEPDKLHQMLGRAGRLGYDTIGYGIILTDSRGEEASIRRAYFETSLDQGEGEEARFRLPNIESNLSHEAAMLEQLLARIYEYGECNTEDLIEFLSRTLWWRSGNVKKPVTVPLLRTGVFSVQSLLNLILRLAKSERRDDQVENHTLLEKNPGALKGNQARQRKRRGNNLKILSASKDRIEAKVRKEDGEAWVTCSFSTRGARCDCVNTRLGNPGTEWRQGSRLCDHLVALALHLLSENSIQLQAQEVIVQSLCRSLPIDRLLDSGLITTVNEKYRCTELGITAASLYLHPLTVLFTKNAFSKLHTNDELDLQSMIKIVLRALVVENGEKPLLLKQDSIMKALIQWIDEKCEEEILTPRSIAPGDLHELIGEIARMASSISIIAKHLELTKLSIQFSTIGLRVRFGVKEDLISLMELSIPSVSRKLARKLYDLGYTNETELARASVEELTEVVGLQEYTATVIKQHVEKLTAYERNVYSL